MEPTLLKRCIFGAAESSGINAVARTLYRRSLAVLGYHGVVEQDHRSSRLLYSNTVSVQEFERHLDYLARGFTPMSIDDLLGAMKGARSWPKNPVVITFDDGYRNNCTHAAPILLKKGIPAVFHLATAYIGSRSILWPEEIVLRVVDWPESTLQAPPGPFQLPERSDRGRRLRAAKEICQACKRMPEKSRNGFLAMLRSNTPPVPSLYDGDAHEFMDWDEARQLARDGFTLGSHTVTQSILTALSADRLEAELRESKAVIEQQTGLSCSVISYPNGSVQDFSPAVTEAAKKAGYQLAFTVEDRRAGTAFSAFAVPRLCIAGHLPLPIFCSKVSGLYALLGRGR